MLKDGVVAFEGNATELRAVDGSVHQAVSVVREDRVMPRTRSLAWAELKIGLMSIFAHRHGDGRSSSC